LSTCGRWPNRSTAGWCCCTSPTGGRRATYGQQGVSNEITEDTAYLERIKGELIADGIPTDAEFAYGNPPRRSFAGSREKNCDLIAMSTHGHRFFGDLFFGATAHKVQHNVNVPVLLLRVKA
jgi:nucleotide-binding universal stress UspA family protein